MSKGPKGEKRPADVIGGAAHVMRIATGQVAESSPKAGKRDPIPDLATMDADERVLLVTRKVREARTARKAPKGQARRSTKGK